MAIKKSPYLFFTKTAFGKKAFFFTFLSILLVSILLITFIKTPALQTQKQKDTTKIKITLIDDFTQNLKTAYVPRLLYFTTVKVLNNYTTLTNEQDILAITADGAIAGKFESQFAHDMETQLNSSLLEIQSLSQNKLKIFSAINITNIDIKQIDAWTIKVSGKYSLHTRTNESDVSFLLLDQDAAVNIPIEGLYDPLFMRYASVFSVDKKGENRTIKKATNIDWGLAVSQNFYTQKLYRESADAPGFLERLTGEEPASGFGIESYLDPAIYLQDPDMDNGYSHLDYKYFLQLDECIKNEEDGTVNAELYEILKIKDPAAADPAFYLDLEHIGLYNLTDDMGQQYKCVVPAGP